MSRPLPVRSATQALRRSPVCSLSHDGLRRTVCQLTLSKVRPLDPWPGCKWRSVGAQLTFLVMVQHTLCKMPPPADKSPLPSRPAPPISFSSIGAATFSFGTAPGTASRLQALVMSGNLIGDAGAEALGHALAAQGGTGPLRKLWLNRNRIGPDGAKALAEGLRMNSSLQDLGLASNVISAKGAAAIAAGIAGSQAHSGVTTLALSENAIGDAGMAAMLEAGLEGNTSLTKLIVCSNGLTDAGRLALGRWAARRFGAVTPPQSGSLQQQLQWRDDAWSQRPTMGLKVDLFDPVLEAEEEEESDVESDVESDEEDSEEEAAEDAGGLAAAAAEEGGAEEEDDAEEPPSPPTSVRAAILSLGDAVSAAGAAAGWRGRGPLLSFDGD